MNGQQLCTLIIVAAAAIYLARYFVASARSFFASKSGCGSGCGKCAFAEPNVKGKKPLHAAKTTPSNVIALGDIQTLGRKRENR